MPIDLDQEKLIEHLQKDVGDRWDKRIDRPKEMAEWFYGPGGGEEPENRRDMAKLYGEGYWDGAIDVLEAVLSLDDGIRGAEAIAAITAHMKAARC